VLHRDDVTAPQSNHHQPPVPQPTSFRLCLLCSPLDSPDTILAIIITSVYATDMLLNFFVAFYADGELVTDLRAIARKWLSNIAQPLLGFAIAHHDFKNIGPGYML
jgi:hypothetical protein